ncbi:hypothetical protein FACS189488_14190 [Betaproteobacteria bacterium]|nr:hypothetical protein FACS189488_14190 [Betaproteobacteria bacterium]
MKPRVLVVEDQLDIADLILLHLQHEGFEAVATENGVGAQREIDAVLPDLILLDWMLPGGQSGIDLARKWRAAQLPRVKRQFADRDHIGELFGGAATQQGADARHELGG